MATYDKNEPQSSASPRGGDDAIRNLADANQEINNVDHYWPLDGSQVTDADKGKHRQIQFVGDGQTSGSFTEKSVSVTSGEDALVYKNSTTEIEICMSGDSLTSGALCLDGGILRNDKVLQYINTSGDELIDMIAIESYSMSGSVTKDRVVVKDGLRVSGEVNLSGNLITGVADPVSDQDAATKKYIDDQLPDDDAFGAWDNTTYSKGTDYLASSDGFVIAWGILTTGEYIKGYTDGSNPAATMRTMVQTNYTNGGNFNIMMPVKKGDYWRVDSNDGGTTTINWLPVGG